MAYYLGIDIGGHAIKAGIINEKGKNPFEGSNPNRTRTRTRCFDIKNCPNSGKAA
jgi:predicted NBD/HSP70 family sugar kinase